MYEVDIKKRECGYVSNSDDEIFDSRARCGHIINNFKSQAEHTYL